MCYVTWKIKTWSFPVELSLLGTNSMGTAWPRVLTLIIQDSQSTNMSSALKCCHFWDGGIKLCIDPALVRTHLLQVRETEIIPAEANSFEGKWWGIYWFMKPPTEHRGRMGPGVQHHHCHPLSLGLSHLSLLFVCMLATWTSIVNELLPCKLWAYSLPS